MRRQTIASRRRKQHQLCFRWLDLLLLLLLLFIFIMLLPSVLMNDLRQLHLQCNFLFIFQQSNCHWQREREKQRTRERTVTCAKSLVNSIGHPSSDTPVKLSTNLLPEAPFTRIVASRCFFFFFFFFFPLSLTLCTLQVTSPLSAFWHLLLSLYAFSPSRSLCPCCAQSASAFTVLLVSLGEPRLFLLFLSACHSLPTFLPVSRETFQLYPFQLNRVTFLLLVSLLLFWQIVSSPVPGSSAVFLVNHEQMLPERPVEIFLVIALTR